MATNSHIQFGGARRRTLQALALVFAAFVIGTGHSKALPVYGLDEDDGRDMAAQSSGKPTVEAAFPLESYGPNNVARLVITDKARTVSIQVKHVGPDLRQRHDDRRPDDAEAPDRPSLRPADRQRASGRLAERRLLRPADRAG